MRQPRYIDRLARALGVTYDYLLDGRSSANQVAEPTAEYARKLAGDQVDLLDAYDAMTKGDKRRLLVIAQALAGHAVPSVAKPIKPPTDHTGAAERTTTNRKAAKTS